jgi:biopolymer transport protein ExbD
MASARSQFKLSALKRKSELLCRIDMWGFVSIMLALLFLLMPWTVVDRKGPAADLVGARHSTRMPGALKEDALQVMVTRDGQVFFRDLHVMCEDLPDEIREGVRKGAEKRVYLVVDARAKYGNTIAVLDQIRLAGIENVSFLTVEPYR